jgi:hypothetical protein
MSNNHEDVPKDTTHSSVVQQANPPKTETGTCTEKQIETNDITVKEYEKPSYIHGAKDTVAGTIKVIAKKQNRW